MAAFTMRRTTTHFDPLRVAICVLAAATALVHLSLGAMTSAMIASQPALVASMGGATALSIMAALFYCNCTGYIVLTTALYLPALRRFHRIARPALIALAATTVLAYFAIAQGHLDAFGLADKVCEGLLIALLVIEGRRAR